MYNTDQYELRSPDDKKKKVHKFENLGQSDLVLLVCLGLVQMHPCIKYEGSMVNHTGRRGRCKKKDK